MLLPAEVEEELDVVLLAVKARDTAAALEVVAPNLARTGCVVSLQNGLEEYRIAEAVGADRTVGAALTFGGHYVGPGVVHYGGPGSLHVGELDGASTERASRLCDLLSAAHPTEVTDRIFSLLWGKTALGAFYFGTALLDADVLDILRSPEELRRLSSPVVETVRVALACGVEPEVVDGFDPHAFLAGDDAGIEASWEAQRRYWRGLDQTDRRLARPERPPSTDRGPRDPRPGGGARTPMLRGSAAARASLRRRRSGRVRSSAPRLTVEGP